MPIELNQQEINIVLEALGQLPYIKSAPVISNIVKQLPKPERKEEQDDYTQ